MERRKEESSRAEPGRGLDKRHNGSEANSIFPSLFVQWVASVHRQYRRYDKWKTHEKESGRLQFEM